MIKVGIAGVGFMGWIHYLAYQKVDGVRLSAIASRSEQKRSGDWRGIQGNFGPPGREIDLSGVQTYETLDQMLRVWRNECLRVIFDRLINDSDREIVQVRTGL